jgi:hypothetical protein
MSPDRTWRGCCVAGIVREVNTGRLITASSTTGWADLIHGKLWLFPDGLLRVRTDLRATIGNGVVRTVSGPPATQVFTDEEIDQLAKAHKTNRWITSSSITSASIHCGVTTSRLSLKLTDETQIKLLWLRRDPAEAELRSALTGWGVDL